MDWNRITGEREAAVQGQALKLSSAMTSNLQTVIKTKDFYKGFSSHTKFNLLAEQSVRWLTENCWLI